MNSLFAQKELLVWKSKDGWVAARIRNGKLEYAGGSTQQEAIARLKKMIK